MSPRLPSRSGKGKLDKESEAELKKRKNVKWT